MTTRIGKREGRIDGDPMGKPEVVLSSIRDSRFSIRRFLAARPVRKNRPPFQSLFRLSPFAFRVSSSAFTLVELMAVMAIIGLMMLVALPAIQGGRGSSLISAARQFSNDMTLARQYAVARNYRVRVVIATDKTISDSQTTIPDLISMQFSAYAVMYQGRIGSDSSVQTTGWLTTRPANQPNLPFGRDRWYYAQTWTYLPKGIIFDPAQQDLTSSDGKGLPLPMTTIFFGQVANQNLWDGITRDILPFPIRTSDTDPPRGSEMAFIEFKGNGMPALPGSVRLINGTVMANPASRGATVTVPGRDSFRTANGSKDPAGMNCVVLSWDGLIGKIKWTQPGRGT